MKYKLLFLIFLCTSGFAQSWLKPAYGLWGIGAIARDRNYVNTDAVFGPGVFIFGGYGPIFIEANRAGFSLYKDGTYFGSVVLQVRSHQFRMDDKNFGNRKTAIEAGIQFGRRLPAGFVTRLAFLHDISGAHDSYEFDLQLYRHNFIGHFRILTALGIQYQNSKLVEYYYGTGDYSPGHAFVGEIEMIITYPFGNWGVFAGSRIYGFDSQVSNSPIADGYLIKQYFAGLGYQF